ncbi:hypothetical protein NP233_g10131 [Leucocoprinus birnbaumii]|uniref:Uncharacterized protein n=1 Tax=Leucocoprinus birnbaumii TaxID=56174 RepID=A0AAD5VMJ5_9AGAR|nr:hypothetical protein NP233_g10131 [Leucocoprinus birnbaumii]
MFPLLPIVARWSNLASQHHILPSPPPAKYDLELDSRTLIVRPAWTVITFLCIRSSWAIYFTCSRDEFVGSLQWRQHRFLSEYQICSRPERPRSAHPAVKPSQIWTHGRYPSIRRLQYQPQRSHHDNVKPTVVDQIIAMKSRLQVEGPRSREIFQNEEFCRMVSRP